MRRSLRALVALGLLALICTVAATATATATATASATPRSASGPLIICPESTVPCCGPPVAAGPGIVPGCCGPVIVQAALCPSSVTISVSPDPSTAGEALKIAGRLTVATGAAGASVALWEELPGQTRFHRIGQALTDSSGQYTFTYPAGSVQTSRRWYVSALGLNSITVQQRVAAVVTLSASTTKAGAGMLVTFKGRVAPSHARERIRIQARTRRGWDLIATGRLTAGSRFTVRKRFSGVGAIQVRAAFAGDGRNIASYSATLRTKR